MLFLYSYIILCDIRSLETRLSCRRINGLCLSVKKYHVFYEGHFFSIAPSLSKFVIILTFKETLGLEVGFSKGYGLFLSFI